MSSSDPNATTIAATAAGAAAVNSSSSSANPHISPTSLSLLDHPHHQHHYHHHPHIHPPSLPPPSPAGGSSNPSSSNSPSSSSLPTALPREYRKGNWTLHETLVLITAKRLDDERRTSRGSCGGINLGSPVAGRSAELRWKWVENYCWRNGCLRSQNQCNDKWDNLLRDYKKVRDYEARCAPAAATSAGGGGSATTPVLSYWAMEKHDRKERNLPSNLAAEVFHALTDVLSRRNANKAASASLTAATTTPHPVPVLALPPPSASPRPNPSPTTTALLLPAPHIANHLAEVPPTVTTPTAVSAPTPSPVAAASTHSPSLPVASTPSPAAPAVATPPPTLPAPAAPLPPPPATQQQQQQQQTQQLESSSVPADVSPAESTPPDTSSSSSTPPLSPASPKGTNNNTEAAKQHQQIFPGDPHPGAIVVLRSGSDAKPPSEPPDLLPRRRRKRSRSRSLRADDDDVDEEGDNSGGMERGASVLARALLACEERREKRHREMLEMEERRARAEEARGEASLQGVAGLIAAVNNLAGAIHALVTDYHAHRPPPPGR